ncbi:MAG: filamentous hemagglutinin N-terminal domain-containing protein, partial [Oscillatoria sp. PMC 1051.18]|nr:filamentous hemagglutinin N-terminal domain-containing protein [Oscillatoria sp. PMC 1051.18]
MKQRRKYFYLILKMAIASLATTTSASAQPISADGSLSTTVTSPDNLNFVITDGNRAGDNLFHSFDSFSVPTNGSAFFNNNANISNIINRVTGGAISNIDGLLRANGTANVFLLNPNGIIFGSNAQLNIGGSFVGSTADSLNFADGTEFSATNSSSPPLLTISVPIGLQYGSNPASIEVRGTNLAVPSGRSLTLAGGEINIIGGKLTATSGNIDLAAIAGNNTVGLTSNNNQIQLNLPNSIDRQNIFLTENSLVSTTAEGSGNIQLFGRQIILENSRVEANTLGAGVGGNITVNASENVELLGDVASGIFNNGLFAETIGTGTAGNIQITSNSLTIAGEARVSAATFGAGDGGNLTVNARETIELIGAESNNVALFTGLLTDAENLGDAGNLVVETKRLSVSNGAQISAATFGAGDGGNLTVNATESIELIGVTPADFLASGLFTAVQPTATGNAGDLTVNTRDLIVRDGAQIFAGTLGAGNGGKLTVNASESIALSGVSPLSLIPSGLFTAVNPGAPGRAGDLTVNTGRLIISNGAQIFAGTLGAGAGGNLTVNASEFIELIGVSPQLGNPSGIFTAVNPPSTAQAGELTINTETLTARDGAQVAAAGFGEGEAGQVTVNADTVELSGMGPVRPDPSNPTQMRQDPSGLLSDTGGESDSGDVTLNVRRLTVRDGAAIAVNNRGLGQAGNLEVQASEIFLNRDATLSASTASGIGGNINLTVEKSLQLQENSTISAEAGGSSAIATLAGNVNIQTQVLQVESGAAIAVNNRGLGQAGNLE